MLFTLSSFLKYLDLCPKCFLFWGQKKHHPVKSGAKPKQIMKNSTSAKKGWRSRHEKCHPHSFNNLQQRYEIKIQKSRKK